MLAARERFGDVHHAWTTRERHHPHRVLAAPAHRGFDDVVEVTDGLVGNALGHVHHEHGRDSARGRGRRWTRERDDHTGREERTNEHTEPALRPREIGERTAHHEPEERQDDETPERAGPQQLHHAIAEATPYDGPVRDVKSRRRRVPSELAVENPADRRRSEEGRENAQEPGGSFGHVVGGRTQRRFLQRARGGESFTRRAYGDGTADALESLVCESCRKFRLGADPSMCRAVRGSTRSP